MTNPVIGWYPRIVNGCSLGRNGMSTVRKRSKQRDSIQRFLRMRKDHPTAEVVYQNIKEEIPNISLGTVYRNLALLSEMGEIQKISAGDGPDRFDPIANPHDHFVCKACGCLIDMEGGQSPKVIREAQKGFEGKIEEHRTFFYGLCPSCLGEEASA